MSFTKPLYERRVVPLRVVNSFFSNEKNKPYEFLVVNFKKSSCVYWQNFRILFSIYVDIEYLLTSAFNMDEHR